MKKRCLFPLLFVATVIFLSLFTNFFLLHRQAEENTVVEVVDGDTFQLKSGKRVRLLGVDAPEYNRCGGKEAKEALSALISNKQVKLTEETTEAYGRTLALVWVDDTLVNEEMLRQGWARTDYRKNTLRDRLTAAFHQGQNKGLNLLCVSDKPPNPGCLIKGNIDPASYEKFYHLPNCSHYSEVKINLAFGEQWFCSEKEAVNAGFKKAAGCPK